MSSSFLHPSQSRSQSRPLTSTSTTTSSTHLHSVLNTTSSISTHAPLNLSGLMGRIKNPPLQSQQPHQPREMEEVLLSSVEVGTSNQERTKYVPSPTLSYYAHFIPVTPASPVPQLPRQTSSSSNSISTSFSQRRSGSPSSSTSRTTGSYQIKRKPPPAPLSLYPGSGVGVQGQGRGLGQGRGQLGMERGLPGIILLDSPIEDRGNEGMVGTVPDIRIAGERDDDHVDRVHPGRLGTLDPEPVKQETGGGGGGNLIKSLFRSKSRPHKPPTHKNPRSDPHPNPEPSPDWVEVEQGYRHPSGAFGLDVDLDLNLNLGGIDLLQPIPNRSPQDTTGSSSPGTGGVLHNILLTPTYSNGTHLVSSARQRTPSPRPRAENENLNSSTLNLLPPHVSSYPDKSEKRKTLLDKAGRLFNDRRMKLVYDQPGRKGDGSRLAGDDRGVKVGGIVPLSLTGFSKGKPSPTSDPNLYALDFLRMQKPGSYARTESYGGSVVEGKGRVGMDHSRDGSGWQGQGRGGLGNGYEKDRRGRSGGDRDALLRKQRRKKLWILAALALLVIASAVIGLCAGLLTRKSSSSESTESDDNRDDTSTSAFPSTTSASSPAQTSSAYTLSTCLSLFALSAPTAPTAYPCDQCLPILNTGENDYLASANDGTGPSGNSTGVGAAVQFCALQSIFANTQGTAKRRKRAGVLDGWMGNTNPCSGWSGVTCDDKARVRSVSLVYPGVPSALDESIGGLVGLESIKMVGNSVLPAGPIPKSIFSSTLKTIEIQSTGLTSLGASAFASLSTLTSLVLVSNAKLGSTLPALPQTLELSTISITGQSLTVDPFPALPASLNYIDLSFNALSGSMPSLSKFTGLQSLFLDSNNYASMAGDIPTSLQDLSIQSNPSLGGLLPAILCSSTSLKTCELQGTNLGTANAQNTTTTQVGAIATRVVNATATTTIMTTATAISTTAPRCGICRF